MLFLFALLALAAAQNANTCPGALDTLGWCDCAPADSGITVTQFFFTPNPPVPGQNITGSITAKDNYKTPVTGGSLSILVEYSGIPLVQETVSLCSILAEAHQAVPSIPACPVPPLELKQIQFQQLFPNALPGGAYSGNVTAVDQNNRVIQCVKFKWTIA